MPFSGKKRERKPRPDGQSQKKHPYPFSEFPNSKVSLLEISFFFPTTKVNIFLE
jgi:hypothetical protein